MMYSKFPMKMIFLERLCVFGGEGGGRGAWVGGVGGGVGVIL